jgi:hypothetical protein
VTGPDCILKKELSMAGDNYAYKKRQRELAQKKKREEKLQKKLAKKNPPPVVEPEPGPVQL